MRSIGSRFSSIIYGKRNTNRPERSGIVDEFEEERRKKQMLRDKYDSFIKNINYIRGEGSQGSILIHNITDKILDNKKLKNEKENKKYLENYHSPLIFEEVETRKVYIGTFYYDDKNNVKGFKIYNPHVNPESTKKSIDDLDSFEVHARLLHKKSGGSTRSIRKTKKRKRIKTRKTTKN